jgi:hypothetical protein
MRKIVEQQPTKQAVAIATTLSRMGFNVQLLGSQKYVTNRLENLNNEELVMLKAAFIKNGHPRLKREFAHHQPYGRKADYVKGLKNADLTKMAKLIKIVGVLLQSKVYLFWRKLSSKWRARGK